MVTVTELLFLCVKWQDEKQGIHPGSHIMRKGHGHGHWDAISLCLAAGWGAGAHPGSHIMRKGQGHGHWAAISVCLAEGWGAGFHLGSHLMRKGHGHGQWDALSVCLAAGWGAGAHPGSHIMRKGHGHGHWDVIDVISLCLAAGWEAGDPPRIPYHIKRWWSRPLICYFCVFSGRMRSRGPPRIPYLPPLVSPLTRTPSGRRHFNSFYHLIRLYITKFVLCHKNFRL